MNIGTYTALVFLAGVASSCGGHARGLYERYPYLEPGQTTLPALRDADASGDPGAGRTGTGSASPAALETFPEMVAFLLDHSPTVAAARERYRAAIERVPQAAGIPDLKVSYTWLPWPVETRVGPNEHRIQLTQAIPFPSKIVARDAAARAMARAGAAQRDRVVRDELTRLKRLFADLYYYARAIAIIDQNEVLARTLSQVAAERYEGGRGQLFDVSKAQSQLAQLQYDRIRITEQYETTLARLNAVLGRPRDAPVVSPRDLPLLDLAVPEERLLAIALERQQELRELDERIRAAEARLREAESSWLPDFIIGLQLMLNDPAAMPGTAGSGDDALGVTFGLSVPLWFWQPAAAVREADAELSGVVWQKKAHLDRLAAELREAVFRERDARRLRVLYDEELLPQALRALESAEQWYRATPAHFTDFLEARGVYYSFALARERALADAFQAVARIEQLIGASLLPEGTPGEEGR